MRTVVLGSCLLAVGVLVAGAGAQAAAKPITLGPGQAVLIAGTDIVCVFGGPANQIGMACLHTKAGTYSFRIDEQQARGFRKRSGRLTQVGAWKQPKTLAQPKSPAVSGFKVVATLPVGGRVLAGGSDLACIVTTDNGGPEIACFKIGPGKGYPVVGSYAALLSPTTFEVDRYDAAHNGKPVFVRKEGK
jgi:hypothetical protein